MSKPLRLHKCVDLAEPALTHVAFRNQYQHAWAYTPACQGARILTIFTLPDTRRADHKAVITCVRCFQIKREYDAAQRSYEKKVLRR